MAKLKTIKNGELYLMKDGSVHRLVTGTVGNAADLNLWINSGTWVTAYTASDLFIKSGNHVLSQDYDAGFGTAVLNATHPIQRPVFLNEGSTVYCWYAYDAAGGSAYTVYYSVSTDGGATWSAGVEVVTEGAASSWNQDDVMPVGVHRVDADTTYLFVAGVNGSTWRVGRWTIDTSAGTANAIDYSIPANYTAYGSNPVTGSIGERYATIIHDGTSYHMWHGTTATATAVYHNKSGDGLAWPDDLTANVALRAGASGTLDDAGIRVGSAFHHEGWYYLLYRGYDGSSNYAMAALSRNPERLIKCGNIETPSGYSRAPFSADLTYTAPDEAIHIPDRLRFGVLADGSDAPMDLSFTFKLEGISATGIYNSATDGQSGRIFANLLLSAPSVREGSGHADSKSSFNLLYRLDSDAEGTKDDFYLFLDCHPLTTQFSEQADGVTVTATVRCYGASMPLTGRF